MGSISPRLRALPSPGPSEAHPCVAHVELSVVAGDEGVTQDPRLGATQVDAQDSHDASPEARFRIHIL